MKCLGSYLIFVGCIVLAVTDAQDIVVTFNNEEKGEAKLESGAESTYIIFCEVRPSTVSENPNLMWIDTKTGNPVPLETVETYSVGVRRESQTMLKLSFNGVKESHAGVYNCTGTINGETKFKQIRVEVTVKVEMDDTNVPPYQTIIRGKKNLIKCQPQGPNPTITWYRRNLSNKMNLTSLPRFNQVTEGLSILNVEEKDADVYICRAEAGSSYKMKAINVSVNWPPTITQGPLTQDAVAGTSLILTCIAEGKPKAKYEWFKDQQTNKLAGSRYEINEQDGVLKIINVIKEDSGQYKCLASNGVQSPAESTAKITVVVRPEVRDMNDATFDEGGQATITCKGTGDPVPVLTWSKEGESGNFIEGQQEGDTDLSVSSTTEQEGTETIAVSLLTITNLEEADKGIYKCKAKNKAGEASKNVKLIVQYTPNFNDQPYTSKYTWPNQVGMITCVANGVPRPDIRWFKNGTEIATGGPNAQYSKDQNPTGPEQVTSNLRTAMEINFGNIESIIGKYRCLASNVIGSTSKNITLDKAARPRMPKVTLLPNDTPTTVTMVASITDVQKGPPVETMQVTIKGGGKEDQKNYPVDQNGASNIKITGKPYKIVIKTPNADGKYPNKFLLNWNVPDNGGSPITAINIKYRLVIVRDEKNNENRYQMKDYLENFSDLPPSQGNTVSKEISGLKPDSYYEVQVTATNRHGTSDPESFIFKTSKVGSLSIGAIIGIVIVVFIVLFIIVDVTCYFRNKCGVLMCLKDKLGGGGSGDTRSKEDMMEGGDEETTKMLPKDNEPTPTPTEEKEKIEKVETPKEETATTDEKDAKPSEGSA
ncbi:hypothetical protein KUTeg_006478 [Tegillarca granosa]|uniref:Uncharacterized protein n=1 Tax=Tegillarca granosa TaxID=220873 RepID=A0ABQ9FGM7_TEGGR|nr:hypothetical protein KUTeg_006478 [Tegillarca granosa]